MTARKCDRCGKFYEPYEEKDKRFQFVVNGIAFVRVKTDSSYSGAGEDGHDLCPECLTAVIDFMFGERKNNDD